MLGKPRLDRQRAEKRRWSTLGTAQRSNYERDVEVNQRRISAEVAESEVVNEFEQFPTEKPPHSRVRPDLPKHVIKFRKFRPTFQLLENPWKIIVNKAQAGIGFSGSNDALVIGAGKHHYLMTSNRQFVRPTPANSRLRSSAWLAGVGRQEYLHLCANLRIGNSSESFILGG